MQISKHTEQPISPVLTEWKEGDMQIVGGYYLEIFNGVNWVRLSAYDNAFNAIMTALMHFGFSHEQSEKLICDLNRGK